MTTVIIPIASNAEKREEAVIPTRSVAQANRPSRVPLFVPAGQLYYWTREWQAGEADALRDLAEGRFRSFHDGTSAASWLLSDEE